MGATTANGSTGGASVPPPEGCACTNAGYCDAFGSPISTDCGGEELCPAIVTDCARPVQFYGCIGQDVLLDEAALACALDALAARTPGWFDIQLQDLDAGCGFEGCSHDRWRVQVLAGSKQAVVSNCYQVPLDESPDATNTLRDLETAAYFVECKSASTAGAQLDCLFAGLQRGALIECP